MDCIRGPRRRAGTLPQHGASGGPRHEHARGRPEGQVELLWVDADDLSQDPGPIILTGTHSSVADVPGPEGRYENSSDE